MASERFGYRQTSRSAEGCRLRVGETARKALFHQDQVIALDRLRQLASDEVRTSSLICRASQGDGAAARRLHVGFWPFVREFELAIDSRKLPRAPLRTKYGRTFEMTFLPLAGAVREMKEEEGSHAAHWRQDAEHLGIENLDAPLVAGVSDLINAAYTPNLTQFFSVLAGTEFIAEELSAFLVAAPPFLALFDRKRWAWGEVHLLPHEHGSSHLEIDIDLARAYRRYFLTFMWTQSVHSWN